MLGRLRSASAPPGGQAPAPTGTAPSAADSRHGEPVVGGRDTSATARTAEVLVADSAELTVLARRSAERDATGSPETAAALGCSEGTVKSQVSKGLDALRRALVTRRTVLWEGS